MNERKLEYSPSILLKAIAIGAPCARDLELLSINISKAQNIPNIRRKIEFQPEPFSKFPRFVENRFLSKLLCLLSFEISNFCVDNNDYYDENETV